MEIRIGTEILSVPAIWMFGIALLATGIVLGSWLSRRAGSRDGGLEQRHLRHLIGGLSKWTNGLNADVSQYQQLVKDLTEHLDSTAASTDQPPTAVVAMLREISDVNEELQSRIDKAEVALQEQTEQIAGYMSEARTDTLTGLPNRRVFDEELGQRVAEWNRYATEVAVMIIDVDFFKKFNDQHGHLAGDAVLQQVARTIRETMRDTDIVARLGGEEFAAVLPGIQGEAVLLAAERTRRAIETVEVRYEGTVLSVTVSCGAAMAIENDVPSELVKRADEALYAAKKGGRNCSFWHDGSTTHSIGSGAARRVAADSLSQDPEFGEVCHQLRERLLSVIGE